MNIYLPEEILAQILQRLPVKSLLRCMCVNKSWYYLIQDPVFVTAHHNYQKSHHAYLLFTSGISKRLKFSLRVDDVQREEYVLLESLPRFLLTCYPSWHSVSNGLTCFSYLDIGVNFTQYNTGICLWNPATQKFKTLPDPPRLSIPGSITSVWLAFGFCPKANDFKVVKIEKCHLDNTEFSVANVYCLATNRWKMINNLTTPTFVRQFDSVFLNGTAYFRGFDEKARGNVLMCFDTDKDTLNVISLPEVDIYRGPGKSVHVFGESIALFMRISINDLNMWLLKEGATNEICWEKKITLSFIVPGTDQLFEILGMTSNSEVLLLKSSFIEDQMLVYEELVLYNVEEDEEKNFGWNEPPDYVSSYAESLVMFSN